MTYEQLIDPNLAYIFGKNPMMTNIVGGYLTDLWTYIGLCSLHRFFHFSWWPKMKGKELHAHVRALLAEMEDEDKDEFFADTAEEGF